MFRSMRRSLQVLPEEVNTQILQKADTGILSLLGDGDYPYGVPLNFVYYEGHIYFHCALTGHKTDAMAKHDKACFTIVSEDAVNAPGFSTDYRSLILFGRLSAVTDPGEKRRSIEALCKKYSPMESSERVAAEIEKYASILLMLRFDIEHRSGKEGKALAMKRREEDKGRL